MAKRTIIYITACLFLFCSNTSRAGDMINDPVPDDFAYGAEIKLSGNHAFQTVELPDHYYFHTGRRDGRDLRVFNAEGYSLPFMISNDDTEQEESQAQQLPFFPIYGRPSTELDRLDLSIKRDSNGTVIDISDRTGKQTGAEIIAYIIDNSYTHGDEAKGRLYELEFDWVRPEYGFVNDISLEKSADLANWSALTADESLSNLSYRDEVIGKHVISIDRETERFLRISWNRQQPFEIRGITARYQWSQSKRELHWHTVDNLAAVDDTGEDDLENGSYRFSVKGYAPVQRFTFNFDDDNAFYRGTVYSRPDGDSGWINRGRFMQYKLSMPGGTVKSAALRLPPVRDNDWLIKFDTPDKFSGELPAVKLAWYPERLTFLSQGTPPYTLAYGNPRVAPAQTDLTSLFNSLNDDQRSEVADSKATLYEPKELGGSSRLEPEPEKFPWKTVLLWLVLVAGVLIMAKMAVSLFKQMDEKH